MSHGRQGVVKWYPGEAERLFQVESKLATIEGTLVKTEERSESDSKELDAVLTLLANRQE